MRRLEASARIMARAEQPMTTLHLAEKSRNPPMRTQSPTHLLDVFAGGPFLIHGQGHSDDAFLQLRRVLWRHSHPEREAREQRAHIDQGEQFRKTIVIDVEHERYGMQGTTEQDAI